MAAPLFYIPATGEVAGLLGLFGFGKFLFWSKTNKKITDTLDKCNEVSIKVEQLEHITKKLENLEKVVEQIKTKSDSTLSVQQFMRILKQELKNHEKPSFVVQFYQNDTAIFVTKVVVVGAIGYGVMKWKGYSLSVSEIVNGTKRSVAGALSSMTKNVGKKSAAISEKMRNLSEQLDNCGKPDEPKETTNLEEKVSEVGQDISQGGNVFDLNEKLYDLIPLEGSSCKLYRMDEQDIVAEAIWATDDPATKVHGCELGRNACKVWVTKAVEPNAKVWRPAFGIQIMEEATKSFIAWPADHIIYDVDYDKEAKGGVMENLD